MEYRDYEGYLVMTAQIHRRRVFAATGLTLDEADLMSEFNLTFLMASKAYETLEEKGVKACFKTYLTRCLTNAANRLARQAIIDQRHIKHGIDPDSLPDGCAHFEPVMLASLGELADGLDARGRSVLAELLTPTFFRRQGRYAGCKVVQDVAAATGISRDLVYLEVKKISDKTRKLLNFC